MNKLVLALSVFLISTDFLSAQVVHQRDIIYQKTEGVALTMDVFVPEKSNGIGIVKIVSGGWKSRHSKVKGEGFARPYVDQGYTVFAVFHGSQPRYQVRDIMGFIHRAVRFIRFNAERWKIDPARIGVTGASAGGHLSLVLATKGGPGDPQAKDPIDRVSSAVQAVGVFYPPTDYLNWSQAGDDCVGVGKQERWQPAFGDESKTAEGRQALGRHMSSIYHLSEATPPVSIIHGDADPIVPLFQSESFKKVAESKGVLVELVVKQGAGHGWPNRQSDDVQFLKWFDQHLLKSESGDKASGKQTHSSQVRLGTCDWSIQMPLSEESFRYAQTAGLAGIQYSFDAQGQGLDLRLLENREKIREVVQQTGVGISSLGIGLLNKIPFATTDEGEQLVVECIETMVKLKEESTRIEDRELAAKVSPDIVLLAFFGKGDINGKPKLIQSVITKLKRIAPAAEKHGFVLGIESLLNESDLRHIIAQVGSPAVKVYYDTGNSDRMGYDIFKEIESLGTENICEIHIKENKELLGKGPIDFRKFNSLLNKIGYEGWLIIEGSCPKGIGRADAATINAKFCFDMLSEKSGDQ